MKTNKSDVNYLSSSRYTVKIQQKTITFRMKNTKKQNLRSETWIEQGKSHVMAGATLTGDFWANDILWQLFQKLRVEWSLLQLYRNEEIIIEAN